MSLLTEDEELLIGLGKNALWDVEERFHPNEIIPMYDRLFKEVLKRAFT